jgi:hypothetical protein
MREDIARLMRIMESKFSSQQPRNENTHQHVAHDDQLQYQAPPPPPPPEGHTHFNHHQFGPPLIPRMEPPRIPDVWFSGDSAQILSFLRTIRDHLCPRVSFFETDTQQIIWISQHFGYCPSTQRKSTAPSPAENWYTSLITDNA